MLQSVCVMHERRDKFHSGGSWVRLRHAATVWLNDFVVSSVVIPPWNVLSHNF